MHAFFLTRPLTLNVAGQRKTFCAVSDWNAPLMTEVYVAAQMEIDRVRTALREAYPEESLEELLRFLTPHALAQVSGLPKLLGIRGANGVDVDIQRSSCLVDQLRALRAIQPDRQHYRLLLVNAFGANLGDCLVGLTAFRHVLSVLRAELPAVSVDVLLGWHGNDGLRRLFRSVDGIDNVLTQGPTLAELSRYQAMFDTSELLNLPRYGAMPVVDWNLWWMGLDPEAIAITDKRNQIDIAQQAEELVANYLPPHDGPRILINPKASVTLRGMPEPVCRHLIARLLSTWPQAQVILIQAMDFEHPRVINLSAEINNVDYLAAIVAKVDALIGVDTYTQHLADATDTPAVTLYTSVSPELYPYYPLVEAMSLPDIEHLPAWGKMKVSSDVWENIAPGYEEAWQSLDWDGVFASLRRVMARKNNEFSAPRLPSQPIERVWTRKVMVGKNAIDVPLYQRDEPLAAVLNQTLLQIAEQVLRIGDSVVQLGAGAGELTVGLASIVGIHGHLVAFEPRRQLHQQLCANLAHSGIYYAETHAVMPDGDGWAVRDINPLFVTDDYLPLQFANAAQPESVVCWPLDDLKLQGCRLLIVCSPLPLLSVLQGAKETLMRLKPVVLAGVVSLQSTGSLETYFDELGYRVRILELGNANHPDSLPYYGIVVAEPFSGEYN